MVQTAVIPIKVSFYFTVLDCFAVWLHCSVWAKIATDPYIIVVRIGDGNLLK